MPLLSTPLFFKRRITKSFPINQPGVPGSPSLTEDKEISIFIENILSLTTVTELWTFSAIPATH